MSDKEVSRRGYAKYAAAGVVIVAVAGAGAYYASRPPPSTPAPTTQVQTQTVRETVIETAKPTITPTGTGMAVEKRWQPNPSITGQEIKMVSSPEAFLTGIAGSLQEYKDLTKNNVIIEAVGYAALHEKYILELTSPESYYDILVQDSAFVPEMGAYCTPLNDFINRDNDVLNYEDFAPGARAMVDYQYAPNPTETYGITLGLYDTYQWYRTDILENLGVDYPETADKAIEVLEMLGMKPGHQPIHNELSGEDDLYGNVLYAATGFAVTCDFIYFWNAHGGNFFDPDTGSWAVNDDIALSALEYRRKLFQYGPPGQETYDWGATAAFYDSGKAVFAHAILAEHYLHVIDPATPIFGRVANNIIFQNPDPDSPYRKRGIRRGTTGVGWAATIPNNISDTRKEAAWDFIKWMSDAGRDLERENADSPRESVLNVISKNPKYSLFLKYASENRKYGTIGPPDPSTPIPELGEGTTRLRMPWAWEVYDIMDPLLQQAYLGKIEPKEALDKIYDGAVKVKPEYAK